MSNRVEQEQEQMLQEEVVETLLLLLLALLLEIEDKKTRSSITAISRNHQRGAI